MLSQNYFKINLMCFLISCLIGLSISEEVTQARHAHTYTFRSNYDGGYLTASLHTFRPDEGVNAGEVTTQEFYDSPTQVWDVIGWPKTHSFWVVPRASMLNELTAISLPEQKIPPKNLIDFIPVVKNLNGTVSTAFFIKSVELNTCVMSQGIGRKISYRLCNEEIEAQKWILSHFKFDEGILEPVGANARSKTKFYCKFSGK